jgi:beta-glucosidase
MLPLMSDLEFPNGFLWGTATAAHQVEGDNTNSDWWAFENSPGSPCKEPSGAAIEHYKRYPSDIALLAGLGFNTYRFSVEWARIEPEEGRFDPAQLAHYRQMVDLCLRSKLTPMVTLHHFTLPQWVAAKGGFMWPGIAGLLERYTRKVVETLGDRVSWYCTVNEPGMVAFGGYAGAFPFPPGLRGVKNWQTATANLCASHRAMLAAIKELRPHAKAGLTNAMQEWDANAGGRPIMDYAAHWMEDVYLEAARDDDFVGVQTYTRACFNLPRIVGPISRAALAVGPLQRFLVNRVLAWERQSGRAGTEPCERVTQMGYEYRPQAVAACVRRAAKLLPGKPIVVTENGIATADDEQRIEFITDALRSLHPIVADGIPLQGYIYWSGFDNFEWASGYAMQFGLIGVDRRTQERTIKPSGRFLGDVARANRLRLPES